MDIDAIALGEDFVKAIETTVEKCDVLIAVIGNNWLSSKDDHGDRRLDNPEDFVRMEIGTALRRDIRVIPVLVDGALMPRSADLAEDLKALVRRNALRITASSFDGDCQRLAAAIRLVLEKAAAEQRQCEEKERPQAKEREQERLEAEQHKRYEKEPQQAEPFHRTLIRDFAAQPWIHKIDKLSWLPFAAVSAILFCYALSRGYFPYGPYNLETFDFWLGTLLWVALPSLVTISSFLNYPKRRFLEVIVSLVFLPVSAYFLLTSYSTSMPPFVKYFFRDFYNSNYGMPGFWTIALFVLPVLGAIVKFWLLISRRNKTAAIVRTA
jgi:hypothetical protein